MTLNKSYKITFPNGITAKIKLVDIKNYSHLTTDYIFEYLKWTKKFFESYHKTNGFALP